MNRKNLYHNDSMWKGASPTIFKHAQQLRENPTEAEKSLWKELQEEPFKQYHFRRQHPIHMFIADFYSHKLRLIIEVDGEYHDSEVQYLWDKSRMDLLVSQELKIIRFTNNEVFGEY